jgi:hypothetical protein
VYESGKRRMAAITLTAIVSLANIASLGFLVHELLYSGATLHGRQLLSAAGQIWCAHPVGQAAHADAVHRLDPDAHPRRRAGGQHPQAAGEGYLLTVAIPAAS